MMVVCSGLSCSEDEENWAGHKMISVRRTEKNKTAVWLSVVMSNSWAWKVWNAVSWYECAAAMYRRQSLQEGGEGEFDMWRDEPVEGLWRGSSAVGVSLLSTPELLRHGQELAISKAARAKIPWSRNGCSRAACGTRYCHICRSSHAGVDMLGAVMVDHRCMSCNSSSC